MLKRVLLFAAALPLLCLADFLPLENGNSWTYRRTGGDDEFTIRVGAPEVTNGTAYYPLTGYVTQTVWVRTGEDRSLHYRDKVSGLDAPLTLFTPGQTFDAPLRVCAQQGTPEKGSPLVIQYRVLNCADAGTVEEEYLDNVGMTRRTVETIAGPRTYSLVHARVGGMTFAAKPGATFSTSIVGIEDKRLIAALHLSVSGPPLTLLFTSSQDYALVLRNARGDTLWVWSQGRHFLQALHQTVVDSGLAFTIEVPLAQPLSPGFYTLEGWLTSSPKFAASTGFEVPVQSASEHCKILDH